MTLVLYLVPNQSPGQKQHFSVWTKQTDRPSDRRGDPQSRVLSVSKTVVKTKAQDLEAVSDMRPPFSNSSGRSQQTTSNWKHNYSKVAALHLL